MTSLLRINREGLHILVRTSWGETREAGIRADYIKNVRVSKEAESGNIPSVVVETDADIHAIGGGFDKDALEWLKNCILSVVAK